MSDIKKTLENYIFENNFNEDLISSIAASSELISKAIINNKRIFFVTTGSFSDILAGIKKDIAWNFKIDLNNLIIMNAGESYKNEVDDWRSLGAIQSIATFDLQENDFSEEDVMVTVSSSAKSDYVIGAISYANDIGARTILITNALEENIDVDEKTIILSIENIPTVKYIRSFEGTTKLKLILDALFLDALKASGRIYKNHPIFIKWNSTETREWAVDIIESIIGSSTEEASKALEAADGSIASAIIMNIKNISLAESTKLLKNFNYNINEIL